jgi:hypothetical protein
MTKPGPRGEIFLPGMRFQHQLNLAFQPADFRWSMRCCRAFVTPGFHQNANMGTTMEFVSFDEKDDLKILGDGVGPCQ